MGPLVAGLVALDLATDGCRWILTRWVELPFRQQEPGGCNQEGGPRRVACHRPFRQEVKKQGPRQRRVDWLCDLARAVRQCHTAWRCAQ